MPLLNEPFSLTTRYEFLQHEIDALDLAAARSEHHSLPDLAQDYRTRAAALRAEQSGLTVEQAAQFVKPDIAF